MSSTLEIRVPDIGDFKDVPVIEVLVKPGDRVKKNDSLVTLESDKASMEVPATGDGVVQSVSVKVGDKVAQGTLVVTLASESTTASPPAPAAAPATPSTVSVLVPDIGDFKDVPVIEVLVKPGDTVKKNDSLVTLESDKASMEVPSTADGVVQSVNVKVGDKVEKGTLVVTLSGAAAPAAPTQPVAPPSFEAPLRGAPQDDRAPTNGAIVHASPAIRRFARELGVDLNGVRGSGPNGRITREDVQGFVKRALASGGTGGTLRQGQGDSGLSGLPAWPKIDFAQFGAIESKPLPRIKKISGPNLHRNWVQIPHITNYDEADITELEAFRVDVNTEQGKSGGPKVTMLAFMIKAAVAALQKFPEFNASLDGENLICKRYFNIGFAADTPSGLVVPVLKGADKKGLLEIAKETAELAGKARDGKLGMSDMQGGSFTISSIGGIGGTAFTQIVNAPEVAILGATRSAMKPVWDGKAFVPRLMLPISVSYDHRVIDGAGAARFLVYFASLLRDFRRVLL